jgi:hypothetical protein
MEQLFSPLRQVFSPFHFSVLFNFSKRASWKLKFSKMIAIFGYLCNIQP